jgi:hypothetical protein
MAQGALFIGWGAAAHGREQQALQLFGEAMAHWGGLQQRGEIDSFLAVGLEPHGGDLAGFVLMQGDEAKLARLRTDEEFVRMTARAQLCLDSVGVVGAYAGEGLQRLVATFGQAVGELGAPPAR